MTTDVIRTRADSETSSTRAWEVFHCGEDTQKESVKYICIGEGNEYVSFEEYLELPSAALSSYSISTLPPHLSAIDSVHLTTGWEDLVEIRFPGGYTEWLLSSCGYLPAISGAVDWIDSVEAKPLSALISQRMASIARIMCHYPHSTLTLPQAEPLSVSPRALRALRTEFLHVLPTNILMQLAELAKESFKDIESLSFELIEDPEIQDYKRICMEINLRGSVEEVSAQYDRYIESFIEQFPPKIRRWITTGIDIV